MEPRYIAEVFGPGGILSKHFDDYQPRPGQVEMARAVDRSFRESRHLMVEGPTGCHAAGQKILMYDGSLKTVEDIIVGDKLMGPDDHARTVLSLCRGREEMVDIIPTKGNAWRVNRSHILTLVRTNTKPPIETGSKDYRDGEVLDVPIREWEEWSTSRKHIYQLFRVEKKNVLRTGFSVSRTGKIEDYFGFSLDGDGRYLLDDFTVTHNTGKSIAYGIPAAYCSVQQNVKVAIVTANIALQEQLFCKDLPFLKKALPIDFTFALIKGRNNYLCVDRWQSEQSDSSLKGRSSRVRLKQYRDIIKWGRATRAGDKSELDFEPYGDIWRMFSVTSDECKGSDCKSRDECYAERAKAGTSSANVFVTNYHLLFADLKVRMSSDGTASVLPDYDFVVCDEGHKAADIARDFFGFRVSERSITFAASPLSKLRHAEGEEDPSRLYRDLKEQSSQMFYDLGKLYRSRQYKTRLKKPPKGVAWKPLCESLDKVRLVFRSAMINAVERDEKASYAKAAAAAARIAGNVRAAMTLAESNEVYFLEEIQSNKAVVLKGKPISVSAMLDEALFKSSKSVVTTSATLAVNGRFGHLKNELGCAVADELVVDSPFRFQEQALLIVPDGMPMPTDRTKYPQAVADAVVETIKLARGRVLGLFTSYKNLALAHETALAAGLKQSVMRQGEAPRTSLVEMFRSDKDSVLLGTESFWAGVDVPGDSLSCVVIDRLPFPTPDDPVLDAISARSDSWFMSYSVPRAVIAFKQGFGRLIRSMSDRGVVVVLDQRIAVKPYGGIFLASLPSGVPKSRKIENVRKFLYEMGPGK